MTVVILLALAASVFTATSSVAQRLAAAPAPNEMSFNLKLLGFLLHRKVWFFGILCMIAGFGFQVAALRKGDLALVQPVIATELLFVFAYLALRDRHRVRGRDWLAAVGMAIALGIILYLANPSGGSESNATAWHWFLSAIAVLAAVVVICVLSVVRFGRHKPSRVRKAVLLSVAAGIAWGFVAAVIKELSTHIGQGPAAVFSNWSPYVLLLTGAGAMFILSNAFQAGPLAVTQPGLTLVDPLVASLLGITIFGEHLSNSSSHLAAEAVAAVFLVGSVILLSGSPLIETADASGLAEDGHVPAAAVRATLGREPGSSASPTQSPTPAP
jgi:drug/metabolite transporter (DMT)-like permease